MMSTYVRSISAMVRSQGGSLGARVYPTEAMNMHMGLDVQAWLTEGILDYVVPIFYIDFVRTPLPPPARLSAPNPFPFTRAL